LNKNIKIFINWFLGPVLLVWLGFYLYRQLVQQLNSAAAFEEVKQAFTGPRSWRVYLAVLLMPVNWGLEALKWKWLVSPIQKVPFFTACKAVLAGTAMAVHTPNRVGEYFGRMIYVEEGNRLRSIALTVVGSFSQLIITLLAGVLGTIVFLYWLHGAETLHVSVFWIRIFLWVTALITVGALLVYFKLSWLSAALGKIPFLSRYRFFFNKLDELENRILLRILLLSALRYSIFMAQYLLVMRAFGLDMGTGMMAALVSVLFLVLTAIPSIVLAEAGIRGTASVEIFGLFTTNITAVVTSGWFIWLVNLMLPALLGGLLLLGKRIFRKDG
jgi:hypothetical protein